RRRAWESNSPTPAASHWSRCGILDQTPIPTHPTSETIRDLLSRNDGDNDPSPGYRFAKRFTADEHFLIRSIYYEAQTLHRQLGLSLQPRQADDRLPPSRPHAARPRLRGRRAGQLRTAPLAGVASHQGGSPKTEKGDCRPRTHLLRHRRRSVEFQEA